ncbi:hypothetical protein DFA_06490 [Cavenderia fasciculata]|uniref:Leucine-rich repeat-containing protein n=1 Tax=Cavenderia fasciculata TaxID=261658 RepID=F4PJ54_CACFS|nr:uncharacterized protein DFA_06490 [Cavenderia fasciculata]EGG24340.1 hypothetical protein DFA_06490 [Cavenderia fasciculata]|eukprot:XP_004362191.1 hypothetical protein DFA_06490 [Cavenderia fasciculata]
MNAKLNEDGCAVVQLSEYIQSMIIEKLIHCDDNTLTSSSSSLKEGFEYISIDDLAHLMITKTPIEEDIKFMEHYQLADIALVSKWWMKVTRQRATCITVQGEILESSFFSDNNVERLKWAIYNDDYHYDYSRLPLLLPHLQSIYIIGDNLNRKSIQEIVQVINLFPHIQTDLDLSIDNPDDKFELEWPDNIHFYGIEPNVMVTHSNNEKYFDFSLCADGRSVPDTFHQMLEDLKPSVVNLDMDHGDQDGVYHSDHPILFPHLLSTLHLNIQYDYVELEYLKTYVTNPFKFESLKVGIITCPMEEAFAQQQKQQKQKQDDFKYLGCQPCINQGESEYGDILQDWDDFCTNLTTNTTLKNLWLDNPHGPMSERVWGMRSTIKQRSVSLERLASTFSPIWSANSTIQVLGLSNMANIISPLFFSALCHNQSITTLILANGTLDEEYMPSFCQLLKTNKTILALDISGNRFKKSEQFMMAFQENESIQVLNIAGTFKDLNRYLFDSVWLRDTVLRYLVIDKKLALHFDQHKYFSQSESLIKCFVTID